MRSGPAVARQNADPPAGGLLSKLLRPLLRRIGSSWQMYPIGFLFGLGFDTASEVSLLGLSATEARRGLPIASVFLFPALFTAGMALVDTADGLLVLGVYRWAIVKPVRKIGYNLAITLISAAAALLVAGIEFFEMRDDTSTDGLLSNAIRLANMHFEMLGIAITALLLSCWVIAFLFDRLRRDDPLDAIAPAS